MKRSISILLCLVLIFSSFTFASAVDWSTTDQNNLQSIKNAVNSGGGLYNLISTISGRLVFNNIPIAQMVQNIYNGLYASSGGTSRSVAWWLATLNDNLVTLMGWLDPANSSSLNGILNQILNALVYSDAGGNLVSFLLDIKNNGTITASRLDSLSIGLTNKYLNSTSLTQDQIRQNAHYNLIPSNSASYNILSLDPNHPGQITTIPVNWTRGSPIGNLALILANMMGNDTNAFVMNYNAGFTGYNAQQALVSFADPYSTVTFTPSSATDGIYKYLNAINTPLARLGYVLASDSRIEAQEAAAANEQAVVDNFIESDGDGAVPTSSFSDVSGLSSGVTSNLSTDASPAQIWDIFNSDHGSWFSQETANQLDTTTRTRGSEFGTPLLDKQMEEIYKSLGGGK